jgi:ATP-dependent Clp protease protease subunit
MKKLLDEKEKLDVYFQYGVDVTNRRIFLLGDVDESPISNVIKGLYWLADRDNLAPIELFVGSFGGSEYEMFSLYDVMQSIQTPIYTVALGKCMSAAPLLVAAGQQGHRYSMPNAWWMIHTGAVYFPGGRRDATRLELDHYCIMEDTWLELMGKHSTLSAAEWKARCRKPGDLYFPAEDAVKFGLVDHLWAEK